MKQEKHYLLEATSEESFGEAEVAELVIRSLCRGFYRLGYNYRNAEQQDF